MLEHNVKTKVEDNFPETETPLDPLPYPVYFICKIPGRWEKYMNNDLIPPPVAELHREIYTPGEIWCVQTYIQLKRRGLNVYLTDQFPKGQICIMNFDEIKIVDFNYNSFVIACVNDGPTPKICDGTIVQNPNSMEKETDHFVMQWSVPYIRPRDPSRGHRVENIVFKGLPQNLTQTYQSPCFQNEIKKLGMKFEMSKGYIRSRDIEWWDYKDADVVLAVRDSTPYELSRKPASKLINSWTAGCPAILSVESAYQAIRKSELDYFEVNNPNEALNALRRLKADPQLYGAMIENGWKRYKEFTPDMISKQWRDLLAGPIVEEYQKWKKKYGVAQPIVRGIRHIIRSIMHRKEKKSHIGKLPKQVQKLYKKP